jgi:hypothetical protein
MAPDRRLDILVGIEAGVLGGLAMLACFALLSPLLGYPWWLIPNLLSARSTLTGIASLLVGAGVGGIVNGLLSPGGRLFGLAVAAVAYFVCYLYLWKRLAHAPQGLVIAGFFVYGSVLGYHPHLRRALDH